jgi:hypothetical protein
LHLGPRVSRIRYIASITPVTFYKNLSALALNPGHVLSAQEL